MTDAGAPVRAWVYGGALLIGCALIQVADSGAAAAGGADARLGLRWIGAALFAAATVLFAFGWRGRGSVTARRPMGTGALTVLALWPALELALAAALPATADALDMLTTVFYVQLAAWVAAAVIAVAAIWRAGVVPTPWHRAPAAALAVVAATWILPQLVGVALGERAMEWIGVLFALSAIVAVAAPLVVGVIALVLGLLGDRRPVVQVYPEGPR